MVLHRRRYNARVIRISGAKVQAWSQKWIMADTGPVKENNPGRHSADTKSQLWIMAPVENTRALTRRKTARHIDPP